MRLAGLVAAAAGLALFPTGVTPTASGAEVPRPAAIAFVRDTGQGGSDIWTMARSGGSQRRLTFTAESLDGSPSWSPDGSKIAWIVGEDQLWVMNADGTDKHRIHRAPSGDSLNDPTWAPDGRRLAFGSTFGTAIYVINADGSGLRAIRQAEGARSLWPDWSPDGEWIAFSSTDPTGGLDLHVMRPDGSDPRRLLDAAGSAVWPTWSPDGSRVAYLGLRTGESQFRLTVMRSDGTGSRSIVENVSSGDPSWSPNGSRLVFTRGQFTGATRIYRCTASGDDVRQLGVRTGVHDYDPDYRFS